MDNKIYNQADILYDEGKFDEALSILEEDSSNNPETDIRKAIILTKMGEMEKANQIYKKLQEQPKMIPNMRAMIKSGLRETSKMQRRAKDMVTDGQIRKLESVKVDTSFKDIVGMEKEKEFLRQRVILPMTRPELFKDYGLKRTSGIILYGPPGSGKSYLIKALAGESKANLLMGRAFQLENKYVGDTGKNIHKLFEEARRQAPCIIFMDEIENIAVNRNKAGGDMDEGQTKVSATSTILQELDGVEANNSNIYFIGATNRPMDVDTALMRAGRVSTIMYMPPPGYKERKALIASFIIDIKNKGKINIERIARACVDFSTADLVEMVNNVKRQYGVVAEEKTGKSQRIKTSHFLKETSKYNNKMMDTWFAQMRAELMKKPRDQLVQYQDLINELKRRHGRNYNIKKAIVKFTALYLG